MIPSAEWFWSQVYRGRGPDGCWPWLGGRSGRWRQGRYGGLEVCGRFWSAHVVAHLLSTGQRAPVVRHTCDNPPCCNPRHLVGGTQKENNADMFARGRALTGEIHGRARLSDAAVADIRARFVLGGDNSGLGDLYQMDRSSLWRIATGRSR